MEILIMLGGLHFGYNFEVNFCIFVTAIEQKKVDTESAISQCFCVTSYKKLSNKRHTHFLGYSTSDLCTAAKFVLQMAKNTKIYLYI